MDEGKVTWTLVDAGGGVKALEGVGYGCYAMLFRDLFFTIDRDDGTRMTIGHGFDVFDTMETVIGEMENVANNGGYPPLNGSDT